ncbi:MAG: WD40 repeat protein [Planctomycetaceae bacterium]|jgi:WD40 repeat protein
MYSRTAVIISNQRTLGFLVSTLVLTSLLSSSAYPWWPGDDMLAETRGLNSPILQANFEVPVSSVHALRLLRSGDDLHLLAAGDDSVVHWWQVAFKDGKPDRLVLLHTLRWPVARGQGQILTLDAVAIRNAGVRIAFGGNGVYASTVLLFDSDSLRAPLVLQPKDLPFPQQRAFSVRFHPSRPDLIAVGYGGTPGQNDARIILWQTNSREAQRVLTIKTGLSNADALAFSKDGERLAACDFDTGTMREWTLKVGPQPTAEPGKLTTTGTGIKGIVYTQNDNWQLATDTHGLVSPTSIDRDSFTFTNQTGKTLELVNDANQKVVASLSAGQEASLTGNIQIFARLGKLKSTSLVLKNLRDMVHALDIHLVGDAVKFGLAGWSSTVRASTNGRWSITGRQMYPENESFLSAAAAVVRDHDSGLEIPLSVPGIEDGVQGATITDDGRFAAVAARVRIGGAHSDTSSMSICLFDAVSGQLQISIPQKSQQVPSLRRISCVQLNSIKKNGRSVESISIGVGGKLGIGNVVASASTVLDSSNHMTIDMIGLATGQPLQQLNQIITPSQQWIREFDGTHWTLTRIADTDELSAKTPVIRFPAESRLGRPYSAFMFGVAHAGRVAIGYEFGVLEIRDLTTTRSLRQFYGHDGPVLAISVSEDYEWLASGGIDGVLRGWPLRGLQEGGGGGTNEKHGNELGIEFGTGGDKFVIAGVAPGWPGYFAGFKEGNEIVKVEEVQPSGEPLQVPEGRLQQTLLNPKPGRQIFVTVRSAGLQTKHLTYALFEPLFELWPLSDGQWLVSTPQNLFTASSPETMRRFGWNVNIGREGVSAVRFFPLETFASGFEDRHKIVQAIKKRKPVHVTRQIAYPSSIEIASIRRSDTDDLVTASLNQPADLSVKIALTPNGDEEIHRVTLWCNGRRIEVSGSDIAATGTAEVRVRARDLRSGTENLLVASVTSELNGRTLVGRDVRTLVVRDDQQEIATDPRKPRVHFFAVGVTSLDGAHDVPPLESTANDAWHLGAALYRRVAASRKFEPGYFGWALDKDDVAGDFDASIASEILEPTRAGVLSGFKKLHNLQEEGEVQADDFVCVLLAGHGFRYRWNGEMDEDGFFFVARDTARDLSNAVTGDDLFANLDQLACPVLMLIDACRSGGISNVGIRVPGQLKLGAEIVASSKSGELSYESKGIRFSGGEWIGHGLFSAAVIEALSGEQLQISASGARAMVALPNRLLDSDRNSALTISELAVYLQARVPDLQRKLGLLSKPGVKPQNPEILPSITFSSEHIQFPLRKP